MQLSRTYNRTVIFTIHQPRSNIVALFDKLVLLAAGKLVYSGPAGDVQAYFAENGHSCPPGFNIADYLSQSYLLVASCSAVQCRVTDESLRLRLVDLTMQSPDKIIDTQDDPERGDASDTELDTRPNSIVDVVPSARVNSLVAAFAASSVLEAVRAEISAEVVASSGVAEDATLQTYERAGWWMQFTILSGRSFKNLYRDPMLMLSHYVVSVVVACTSSFLSSQSSRKN